MNELKLFCSEKFGQIRTVVKEHEILFAATDVARCLGYSNPQKAVRDHCKLEGVNEMDTPTKNQYGATVIQKMKFITKGNVLRLVAKSTLPQAEKIESWIFDEVIPSVLETGGYISTNPSDTPEEIMARALIVAQKTIEQSRQRIQMLESENESLTQENRALAPRAAYTDKVLQSASTYTFTQMAIEPMSNKQALQVFEHYKVRTVWDEVSQKWYFSVTDVVGVLTDSANPSAYWRKLKQRLKNEGNESVTNCHRLKLLASDGKRYLTDVADTEQLFRLIQSIPSPKAEPFKQWMAHVATIRIDQMMNPELSIEQAREDYRKKGYSERWINQRMKGIEARNELTEEWDKRGVQKKQYAILTDDITKTWSDRTTSQYKQLKRLDPKKKESLRDNMTTIELALNTLAEASTTEISRKVKPKTFAENRAVAQKGGNVAKIARNNLEEQLGRSVITSQRASDYLPQQLKREELESKNDDNDEA